MIFPPNLAFWYFVIVQVNFYRWLQKTLVEMGTNMKSENYHIFMKRMNENNWSIDSTNKKQKENDRSLRYWLSYAIECQVGSRSKGGHSKSTFARKEKLESELKF